jgi:hypothetical protein
LSTLYLCYILLYNVKVQAIRPFNHVVPIIMYPYKASYENHMGHIWVHGIFYNFYEIICSCLLALYKGAGPPAYPATTGLLGLQTTLNPRLLGRAKYFAMQSVHAKEWRPKAPCSWSRCIGGYLRRAIKRDCVAAGAMLASSAATLLAALLGAALPGLRCPCLAPTMRATLKLP